MKEKRVKVDQDDGKVLHRIEGRKITLVMLADQQQYTVAEEVFAGKDAKNAGELKYVNRRYYTSIVHAMKCMMERLAVTDADNLKEYVEAIRKYGDAFLNALGGMGIKEKEMKECF